MSTYMNPVKAADLVENPGFDNDSFENARNIFKKIASGEVSLSMSNAEYYWDEYKYISDHADNMVIE